MTAISSPKQQMRELSLPMRTTMAGVALIALTGLIHLKEAPEYWGEVRYIGALFALTAAGTALAAIGIGRGKRWGWLFGVTIAVANAVGYVLSRSVGIPQFRENSWSKFLEPVGLASLVVETLFVVVAVRTLGEPRTTRR